MKNRILTNGFRTIKKMFPRFLSLLIISFLGTFSFIGLQSTAPNMLDTLDLYYDQANVYDIRIVSSLGLTDEDVVALEKIEGVKEIEPSYSLDVLMTVNENEYVVNIESMPEDINKLDLIEGEFPSNYDEIVVEENLLEKNGLSIGDTLKFIDPMFDTNEFKIVGVVNSHIYFSNVDLSQNRGTTSIGAGTINYYSYVTKETFNVDYYTSIYITVENAIDEITSKNKYLGLVDDVIKGINEIKVEREQARYKYFYDIANAEVLELESKITNQLNKYESRINEQKEDLDSLKNDVDLLKSEIDSDYEYIYSILDEYNVEIENIDIRINELILILDSLDPILPLYSTYEKELNDLLEVKELINEVENKEAIYEIQLNAYNIAKGLYDINYETYANTASRMQEEIDNARKVLDEIPNATWFVLDRTGNITYTEYVEDTGSIASLAKVFPIIFFAVAVLISLVSMNRMVEDDRNEIGTLKSMGFTNKHIIIKYLMFAFLATLIGSSLGSVLGAIFIPSIISSIYAMLFTLCPIYLNMETIYYILGNGIIFICVLGTTFITVNKVLMEKPSELMRPKAPKSGKRVFLEKIKFIWSKLSFSDKVTVRNLFRYKRRAFVTVLGVAGCTALMMCGFGVKDSIIDIPDRQFGKVFTFDAMVYVNDYNHESDKIIFENDKITASILLQNINIEVDERKATMFVIDKNEDSDKFVRLYDYDTNEKYELKHNKISVTKKLAELENINVGDILTFNDKNNVLYEYEVSSIVENYMEHYIFIDSESYELSGQDFKPNTMCIQTIDLNSEEELELTKELLESEKVISISYVSQLVDKVNNMLKSLDKVVLILIVLASLLSFVVLFNLSSINIHERKREIATLKVLGFYHKEVDSYISKENIILTIIGIAFGLVLGNFLAIFIIETVEIEKGKFVADVKTMSYIYSSLLTVVFTLLVNFISHFSLKKINMIESLKSVE